MKESGKYKVIRTVIGIVCVLALLWLAATALQLDRILPEPIRGLLWGPQFDQGPQLEPQEPSSTGGSVQTEDRRPTGTAAGTEDTQPNESTAVGTEDTQPGEETATVPEDLPPEVVIPPQTDPDTGESQGLQFPYTIPGYRLVIEKLAPYSGTYVEDGSNVAVTDVAMLLVRNDGDFPVEYAQITVSYGEQTLSFQISALPVGARMVVQEENAKAVPDAVAMEGKALVIRRAQLELSEKQILVTDNGDNTLTVRNLTDKTIQTVRVFYKYYMPQEDLYVGGIAFTVRVTRLGAKSTVVVQPSHYTSQTSRVIMALTYDTDA